MYKIELVIIVLILLVGCSPVEKAGKNEWKPSYRIQGGVNKGGITENTDFSEMENTEVDAFSGATSLGVHAGGRVQLPVRRNSFETGADIVFGKQKFSYNDAQNNYLGERSINLYQVMIPMVFNFGIYRKYHPEGIIQIKLGYQMQFNYPVVSHESGVVPDCNFSTFSSGPTIGLSSTPFKLQNGNEIGLYVDVYRGSQIYEDFYNKSTFEEPGSSFIKGGIIYLFGN